MTMTKHSDDLPWEAGPLCLCAVKLPGAMFDSLAAFEEFGRERMTYEAVVAAYEQDGDEADLHGGLQALGYDKADIKWHRENPGQRDSALFMSGAVDSV